MPFSPIKDRNSSLSSTEYAFSRPIRGCTSLSSADTLKSPTKRTSRPAVASASHLAFKACKNRNFRASRGRSGLSPALGTYTFISTKASGPKSVRRILPSPERLVGPSPLLPSKLFSSNKTSVSQDTGAQAAEQYVVTPEYPLLPLLHAQNDCRQYGEGEIAHLR